MIEYKQTKIKEDEWKYQDFMIESLFTSQNGDFDIKKEHINNRGIDVVTAGDTDYGILGKSDIKAKVFSRNTITVDMFGSVKYRSDAYKMVTHARVFSLECLYAGFNEEIGLFLTTCLQKRLCTFGYSNMCSWKKIRNLTISLPILLSSTNQPIIDETCEYHKDGYIPDWKYMQETIKELEQERIKELEHYLIVTGLNDYELTEEDKEVLATKLVEGGQSQSSTSGNGCLKGQWDPHCKEAREFRIGDMFKKIKTDKIRGKANDFPTSKDEENTIPLLTAGIENQGLARFAPKEKCLTILNNVITISANGANTGITYYQDEDFSVLQDAYAIKLVDEDISNRFIGLYLTSCIKKSIYGIYSWSNKAGWPRVQKVNISLPIQTDLSHHPVIDPDCKYHPDGYAPDWDYMEKYIRAMEKVVIKDVVIWKDEMIDKTKMVVNGDAA